MASDRIFGLVTLIVSVAYLAAATQIQTNLFSGEFLPKLFPLMIGGVAAISSLFIVFKPDPDPDWPKAQTFLALGFAVLVLVGYAFALKPLGFLIPTAITAGLLSFQISSRPVPAAISGIGLSIGLFVLFKYILDLGLVAFPKGWIG